MGFRQDKKTTEMSCSPFDLLWDAVMQEQKAHPILSFPIDENEAAKKIVELFATKSMSVLLNGLEKNGRLSKNTELASQNEKAALSAAQRNNLYEALDRYNDAIRYSPGGSVEMPKLFQHRSEILLKLNEKEAAKTDAKRAVGKPSDIRQQTSIEENEPVQAKGKGRRKRNSSRKERPDGNTLLRDKLESIVASGHDKIPTLTEGSHAQLRCASRLLEIKTDPQRGRHLTAAKEIPAGSVVIVEPAYASSPLPPYFTSNCSYCCSPLLSPVGCSQCAAVLFCNEFCRDECLRDFHTTECPVLQHLTQGEELTPMAHLVYRIVMKGSKLSAAVSRAEPVSLDNEFRNLHKKTTELNTVEVYSSDYRAVFCQVTNAESRHSADRFKRAVTALYLTECLNTALTLTADSSSNGKAELTDHYKVLLTSAFLHHLQSSSCNAYQVTQQDVSAGDIRQSHGQDIGGAIFPTIALVNHSCSPNVARHTHGSTGIVRTIRPIQSGEEILDNYGPHFLSDEDINARRRYLRLHYFFECDCPACVEKWPAAMALCTVPTKIHCGGCQAILGEANRPDDLRSLQKCSKCKKKNDLSKLTLFWREFESALPSLLSGDSERALSSALRLLNTVKPWVQSPSNLQARAAQVATLSWSLQGNRKNRP